MNDGASRCLTSLSKSVSNGSGYNRSKARYWDALLVRSLRWMDPAKRVSFYGGTLHCDGETPRKSRIRKRRP